ncbi:MAG: GntR family transcriptional regulator [Oscillospiraceae bacterium]|nr:GntR family transcriptional regulator [Oscillospiraceae bacterium]
MDGYKYMTIVEWSKNYISSKNLHPNDRFLSENELCSIHGVSRQTVRQALKCLESEDIICRVRGSGTFVKKSTATIAEKNSAVRNVGVISTYFSDYIFPQIVTGIEGVLNKAGIAMQMAITHNQVLEESEALKTMIANGVQGLIIEPSKSALPNPNTELYQEIKKRNLPIVFFNAKYPWADFPYTAMNDELAGKVATDYLFECGHTRISGIFALDDIQGHKRYSGFMKSCIEHNIRSAEKDVLWFATGDKSELFHFARKKLLALLSESTAVVCYNDELAIKLLRFCRENNINVPNDVSVIGIDDSKISVLCDVALTTVRHPHQLLGITAAEMLLQQMEYPHQNVEDVIYMPELKIRESVKRI